MTQRDSAKAPPRLGRPQALRDLTSSSSALAGATRAKTAGRRTQSSTCLTILPATNDGALTACENRIPQL